MKQIKKISTRFIIMVSLVSSFSACKKLVDQEPISNEVVNNYYKNYKEVSVALSGCYNGMQEPLINEWQFTELRSDNARQRSVNSTTNVNMELNVLNLYTVNPQHQQIYNYWLSMYKNIRNANYVLRSLGVKYQNNQLVFGTPT
ncbi:MAG: RagB/SusD family nutrient uptake outer membrane protein, partial [Pedobacter sp.]